MSDILDSFKICERIRQNFRKIEKTSWDDIAYALEIGRQIGDLNQVINEYTEYKLSKSSREEQKIRIADELADLILNIYSVCIANDIQLSKVLKITNETNWKDLVSSKIDLEKELRNSVIQITVLCSKVMGAVTDQTKSNLAEYSTNAIMVIASLSKIFNFDLHKTFVQMEIDSSVFIQKHSNNNG